MCNPPILERVTISRFSNYKNEIEVTILLKSPQFFNRYYSYYASAGVDFFSASRSFSGKLLLMSRSMASIMLHIARDDELP